MDNPPTDIPDSVISGLFLKGFVQLILGSILWAIYLCLFPFSIRALTRHKSRCWSKPNMALAGITSVMFCITTSYFLLSLHLQANIIRIMILSNTEGIITNLERLQRAIPSVQGLKLIESLPKLLNFFFGDAICVWRAFILIQVGKDQHPRLIMALQIILISLLTSSAAISIFDVIHILTSMSHHQLSFIVTPHSGGPIPNALAIGTSFITNLFATILIVFFTWSQLKSLFQFNPPPNETTNAISHSTGTTKIKKIIVILTESCIFYCILQLIGIICLITPTSTASAGDVVTAAYSVGLNFFSAMYPTFLIILLSWGISSSNKIDNTCSFQPYTVSAARFADHHHDVHSTTTTSTTITTATVDYRCSD